MNRALHIAYFLVALAGERGISNLKLQKILYFIQREALRTLGRVAFLDRIEAWKFGPVITSVYYEFSGRGSLPITVEDINFNPPVFEPEIENIIKMVWKQRKNQEAWQMVNETHQIGGAWDRAFQNGFGFGNVITIEEIKNEVFDER